MVLSSYDRTLKLWDLASGECLRTYTGHQHYVSSVVLLSDSRQMVSASFDHTLKLWDVETLSCLRTYTGHQEWVYIVVILD
jgi:WD40 repeat protein